MSAEPVTTLAAGEAEPMRSKHTSNFGPMLQELGASVLVSTYQAGKLVMLRGDNAVLNTHFRGLNVPMGLACDGQRLAIGTRMEIWEYHNSPVVARKLEPAGKHDACYLPRVGHTTGNVQVHEMAWAEMPGVRDQESGIRSQGSGVRDQESGIRSQGSGVRGQEAGSRKQNSGADSLPTFDSCPLTPDSCPLTPPTPDSCLLTPELVFVNTRFSCLATRSINHSFVPCWRPPFISALAPEDRCHLNGLGVRAGQVRYVTALGTTDTSAGWRADKRAGGVLMEVPSGEVIARGLSMPHSPRWHDGKLWVLDSGNGRLAIVDAKTGKLDTVAEMPGFTRGLDFHGRFAFIGLSQVRESAVFSGIAIAERPQRACGVWVVDIVTGKTVAFVQFEDAVQEIFAVQVLPGRRFPDLVNDNAAVLGDSFLLPDEALAEVSEPFRAPPLRQLQAGLRKRPVEVGTR